MTTPLKLILGGLGLAAALILCAGGMALVYQFWPRQQASSPASSAASLPATTQPAATIPQTTAPSPTTTHAQPTPTPAPAIATPQVDFENLAPYRQAMLPNFSRDIEAVAAAGASHYYLEVTIDPASLTSSNGLVLHGLERVRYTNTEATSLSEIYFRLYPNLPGYGGKMAVDLVIVNGQPVAATLAADGTALRVPLESPLPPGQSADLSLMFRATAPTSVQQGYNIFSYSGGTAALAGFYPVIAVHDQNGWDLTIAPFYGDATYLDTALYQVQLTVPEPMVVAASGNQLSSQVNGDGTQTLRLVSGPMRDFYVAMRPDFQLLTEEVDGTVVNSYYPPGLEAGAERVLGYAVDALRVYNQRFGPYPFAELDLVATPTTAGGVEYPGIVVIAQNLYNEQGGFFEHATVHEVAHQWWYSLVGNNQVAEPWLDESLTNYSTVLYWAEVKGEETANLVINSFFLGPYQQARDEGQDRPVIGPVAAFSPEEYGIFVYGKGPLFFNALRQEVGDETYFEIMQTYYATYKYQIARSDDLFRIIEEVSGQNVEPLLETWLEAQ